MCTNNIDSGESLFTKKNIDSLFKELAKQYRKLGGKILPAEITLIGGAAIIENYSFRAATADIDALILATSAMKEAITRVRDAFNLSNDWINDDFKETSSYSPRLREFSKHYKDFYGVLEVRTIAAEYLIAMKLRSGREYKHDFSDIVGILKEHKENNVAITQQQISNAVKNLYGGWDNIPSQSLRFLYDVFKDQDYAQKYEKVSELENQSSRLLAQFVESYPAIVNNSNANEILHSLLDDTPPVRGVVDFCEKYKDSNIVSEERKNDKE